VDSDVKEQPAGGYATMNAGIGIHAGAVRITTGVENLLDR
jgi:hypothetical protein